jgi:predicted anti-sigma-YlaC factor YlaD
MDCKTFRDNHASFIDGLPGDEELVAMQCHVAECSECAGHDATVRRALLLFRNMPSIEPSPEFADRLQARLRTERRRQRDRAQRAGYGAPRVGTFAALAAGALAAGFIVVSALDSRIVPPALALSPLVVATAPPVERTRTIVASGAAPVLVSDSEPDMGADPGAWSPLTDPAFAAAASSGLPVWPAAVLAAHPPTPLGAPQLKLTNLER